VCVCVCVRDGLRCSRFSECIAYCSARTRCDTPMINTPGRHLHHSRAHRRWHPQRHLPKQGGVGADIEFLHLRRARLRRQANACCHLQANVSPRQHHQDLHRRWHRHRQRHQRQHHARLLVTVFPRWVFQRRRGRRQYVAISLRGRVQLVLGSTRNDLVGFVYTVKIKIKYISCVSFFALPLAHFRMPVTYVSVYSSGKKVPTLRTDM
jgi:hypothetical protein